MNPATAIGLAQIVLQLIALMQGAPVQLDHGTENVEAEQVTITETRGQPPVATVLGNIQRESEASLRDYFGKLESGDMQSAWNMLSARMRQSNSDVFIDKGIVSLEGLFIYEIPQLRGAKTEVYFVQYFLKKSDEPSAEVASLHTMIHENGMWKVHQLKYLYREALMTPNECYRYAKYLICADEEFSLYKL